MLLQGQQIQNGFLQMSSGENASGGITDDGDAAGDAARVVFAQGISSPSLANLSTLSASACVSAPVALPTTLGGSTTLSLLAEDDSPAVLVDAGRSRTSGSGLGGATPAPPATSVASIFVAKCGLPR